MTLTGGIDVSKNHLDIFFQGRNFCIPNTEKAMRETFKPFEAGSRFVLEATGKYHRLAHELLTSLGFEVMVINPYQSRHFARALHVFCKTDKVDAKILASFCEKMEFEATPPAMEIQLFLQELSRHLADLNKLKHELGGRLKEARGFIADSLKASLEVIKTQIKATEKQIEEAIANDPEMQKKSALLQSIPGIGKCTTWMLLSYFKELGQLTPKETAALAGLAPMNQDSGMFKGKRRIKGGRREIRAALYMPTLGAVTWYNKRLMVIYQRLIAAGKPHKVAITACMRQLIIWANAILATKLPWRENFA